MADGSQEEGDRIARLLEELRAMAGPTTWQRVEELVRRIVSMYGEALGRVLEVAGEGGKLDPSRAERLCQDELVGSLLLLHGLHPVPTADRVARAVESLRERLAPDVGISLEGLGPDRVARLRVTGEGGCGGSGAALARGIEHALLEAAPELAGVEIEGLAGGARPERLVTLRGPRALETEAK